MFYHLLYPLAPEFGVFNVFRYITFRTGAATLTALLISFMVGPALIRALERLEIGQPSREDGPDHHSKAGPPNSASPQRGDCQGKQQQLNRTERAKALLGLGLHRYNRDCIDLDTTRVVSTVPIHGLATDRHVDRQG